MKTLAAICPLCEMPIVLGPAHDPQTQLTAEAIIATHMQAHPLVEWVDKVQELRDRLDQLNTLRAMPRCVMPRA